MCDWDTQMGICHRITALKCKDKICFQNQLITQVCTPLGFLWKVMSVSQKCRMPLLQMTPDSDRWNIWAESFMADSTQPLDSSQWIKEEFLLWIDCLRSKFKNPHHAICCAWKSIFVDSEPPLATLNLTCPSYWQKGSIWKFLLLSVQL